MVDLNPYMVVPRETLEVLLAAAVAQAEELDALVADTEDDDEWQAHADYIRQREVCYVAIETARALFREAAHRAADEREAEARADWPEGRSPKEE
jgi:hypothetical protein